MLTVEKGGIHWRLSPLFPALLVMMLCFESMAFMGRCVAAAFWHESGHLLCMILFRKMPQSITIGMFGMRMEQDRRHLLSYRQNIVVSLAGPLLNGVGILLANYFGAAELMVIHTVLMVFNMLPLSMLDGGQILYSVLALHASAEKASKIMRCISIGCLVILYFCGFIVLLVSEYNLTLLLTAVYLTAWMFFSRND